MYSLDRVLEMTLTHLKINGALNQSYEVKDVTVIMVDVEDEDLPKYIVTDKGDTIVYVPISRYKKLYNTYELYDTVRDLILDSVVKLNSCSCDCGASRKRKSMVMKFNETPFIDEVVKNIKDSSIPTKFKILCLDTIK